MLRENNNLITQTRGNSLEKLKKFGQDLLNLVTFLSQGIAGYILHDNQNAIIATAGVVLLALTTLKLVSLSFKD